MFTPIETGIGALLLHQATSILLHNNGGVLGASKYIRQFLARPTVGVVSFVAGMLASKPLLEFILPQLVTKYPPGPSTIGQAVGTVVTGLLVGWGTKAGTGCTSGHMLCGLSTLNARSALAVAIFFPVALITHHLVHPSLMTTACTGDVPCYTPTYPTRETTTSLVAFAAAVMVAARTIPLFLQKLNQNPKKEGEKTKPGEKTLARNATEALAGLEFGLGLHISQMSNSAKVAAFFSFPNVNLWDPSLMLIIVLGILPSLAENLYRGYSTPPKFSPNYDFPKRTLADTDRKFVLGAAVFGLGWGLSGTCPGPAILRAFTQPVWGLLWMGGFWLGGVLVPDGAAEISSCG